MKFSHKAEALKVQIEELQKEQEQLNEELGRVEIEKEELLKSFALSQGKESEAVQRLSEELKAANQQNEAYTKERDILLAEIDKLSTRIESGTETSQQVQQQLLVAQAEITQLNGEKTMMEELLHKSQSERAELQERVASLGKEMESLQEKHQDELKLVRSELASQAGGSPDISQQMKDEFADAMEKVRTTTEQKNMLSKEMEQLKNKMAELQREVTSLRLNEATANVLVSEAKQKIDIYNELEQDWQKKQLRMSERIEELSIELEQAKSRTESEEIDALRREVCVSLC
ncbi:unnamed protein product [Strongylus vulgaris]|uniref:Uncharacterized protein n=1 Tax=Strongylus vulgaris TaxID=40348 RepID=A0A3P7KGI8_STRVU|nr:unnamed protein product [Strongylus vulgaris]